MVVGRGLVVSHVWRATPAVPRRCGTLLGRRPSTVFAFSSENWERPAAEVDGLMGLLRRYLRGEIVELHKNGVRLRFIGERGRLPGDIVDLIADAENLTAAMVC